MLPGVVFGFLLMLLFFGAVPARAGILEEPVAVHPQPPPPLDPDVAATLVVYNENDPESLALAGFYAEERKIPFDHLIGVSCPMEETISRADYDATIAEPLRKALITHGWWQVQAEKEHLHVTGTKIRFVALMRGIPLRIAQADAYEGDKKDADSPAGSRNEAAVDSELATLGFYSRQISGFVQNPYFRAFAPVAELPIPAALLLVCRLDGPDAATVRRMIQDSIAAEKTGLRGFAYVNARHTSSTGYVAGDDWMRHIASDAVKHGIPCVFEDSPEVFPAHYPMRRAALYFGWYSTEVKGPFTDEKFRFLPGAVAVHIYSFSASTLHGGGWCATLLQRGAAATLGNVFEPYLPLTPNLDVFEERLRNGFTFAEAAYASEHVLSWMTTFVGDPLYRPFKAQQDVISIPPDSEREWVACSDGAKLWMVKGRAAGEAALKVRANASKSGIIFEFLGDLQSAYKDPVAAIGSWSRASQFYRSEDDQFRCVLQAIATLRAMNENKAALGLTRDQIKAHPNAEATELLRAIEAQLAPPPPEPRTSARQR